jgi:diguanylate cyclase (GGDEF)-like protein/PAS domain S-box-containing protein
VSPVKDRSGRLVGASAIARNVTRKKRQEQRLRTQFAVTRVLAENLTLSHAAPRLLEVICEGLGWDAAELWSTTYVPPTRLAVHPPTAARDLAMSLRDKALVSGLPVTVRDLGDDPAWKDDRTTQLGFRGAQAWPLHVDGEVSAVLVFLSRVKRTQHADLLDMMGDTISRLQQFLERAQALVHLERLEKAVETIQMGVTITDTRGNILYTNPAEAAMHGYRPEELIGKHVSFFMPPGWKPANGRPSEIRSWRRETVNVRRDGSVFPVQLLSDAVVGPDGKPAVFVTCTEEISDRKRAEEALRTSEERYRMLFERNLAGVYRATREGRLIECNEAFARILGYESKDQVLTLGTGELYFDRRERAAALHSLRPGAGPVSREMRLRRKDGGVAWVLENQSLIDGPDEQQLVEGTLIDITDRKEFEQRIEFHAFHDPLTGLPNRAYLTEQLQTRLAEARSRGRGLAVLFLDLDHFKVVNDTLGHSMGDRLLQQVAARLRECVREDDLVVRMGGDEFVLLLPRLKHSDALPIAQKILARVEEPVHLDEHELCVTASIGIARFPDDGEDVETLLKNADSAMYRAKELGRNGCQEWDKDVKPASVGRLETQARLRHAIERGEMEVWYQPQVGTRAEGIVGVEALLRWRHPERGIVLPSEFVPIAEESGLIVPLGEWVLREACTAARRWDSHNLPPLRVSVNLSVRQFQQPGLVAAVDRILKETGLPPSRLDLEITETLAMQNMDVSIPVLRELAALGVSVSIDDFGVGYSSLSYLKLLPIRRLKIDRSFVAGLGHETRDAAIVKAVVKMAASLDLGVIAEGVETEEQIKLLGELGCHEMQGWAFRGAIPADSLEELVASWAQQPQARAC